MVDRRAIVKRILCFLVFVALLTTVPIALNAEPGGAQKISIMVPCMVTVDVGTNGQVVVNGNTYRNIVSSFTVSPGTTVSFTVTPDKDCSVSTLTMSGSNVLGELKNGVYSVVLNKNETLVVQFAKGSTTPETTPSNKSKQTSSNTPSSERQRKENTTTERTPRTGDDSPVLYYVIIMLTSIGAIVGLLIVRRYGYIERQRK